MKAAMIIEVHVRLLKLQQRQAILEMLCSYATWWSGLRLEGREWPAASSTGDWRRAAQTGELHDWASWAGLGG